MLPATEPEREPPTLEALVSRKSPAPLSVSAVAVNGAVWVAPPVLAMRLIALLLAMTLPLRASVPAVRLIPPEAADKPVAPTVRADPLEDRAIAPPASVPVTVRSPLLSICTAPLVELVKPMVLAVVWRAPPEPMPVA